MVTLGFIGSREMQGVTSLCRFWGLGPNGYYMFLHFFRVSSWSLDALIGCWCAFVLSQNQVIYSNGRAVLFGDHTCVAKDGRRMPSVVTLHQHLRDPKQALLFSRALPGGNMCADRFD